MKRRTRKWALPLLAILVCVGIVSLAVFFTRNSNIVPEEEEVASVEEEVASVEIIVEDEETALDDFCGLIADNYIDSFYCDERLFFSTSGDDLADGLSPETAKRNPLPYAKQGGKEILLRSGDVFDLHETFYVGSNTHISTYGGGGYATLNHVQESDSLLTKSVDDFNVYCVPLNKGQCDTGWILVEGDKSINWHKVLNYSDLVRDKDYYVDNSTAMLYIRSNDDLTGKSVKYAFDGNSLQVVRNAQNVLISSLEVVGAGRHGISISSCANIMIKDCNIHDIGGAFLDKTKKNKLGNGIQIWAVDSHNIFICDNYVDNCFDTGITAQVTAEAMLNDCENFLFERNYIKNCNYCFEFFQYGTTYAISDVLVRNNIFVNAKDVTGGYRHAMEGYTAYLCLWKSDHENTTVDITNNYAYGADVYAISFSGNVDISKYHFANNVLMSEAGTVKNDKRGVAGESVYNWNQSSLLGRMTVKHCNEVLKKYNFSSNYLLYDFNEHNFFETELEIQAEAENEISGSDVESELDSEAISGTEASEISSENLEEKTGVEAVEKIPGDEDINMGEQFEANEEDSSEKREDVDETLETAAITESSALND